MNEASIQAATALPSATVVLIRDGRDAPEVLLVQRHARASFGATYVFPGGLLEPADRAVHEHCAGLAAERADDRLGLPGTGLDYYSAAIRELFEETGVLLGRGPDGAWALTEDAGATAVFGDERRRLNRKEISWIELLRKHRLSLACDRLHYFAHWITPLALRRRFTTRFFATALPAGQKALHDGGELTDSRWMSAAVALAADSDGELELPHPTRTTLEGIARLSDAAAVLRWAQHCEARGVDAWLPAIVGKDGDKKVVMPGDPRYPNVVAGQRDRKT